VCSRCESECVILQRNANIDPQDFNNQDVRVECMEGCGGNMRGKLMFKCQGFDIQTRQRCHATSLQDGMNYVQWMPQIQEYRDRSLFVRFEPCGCELSIDVFEDVVRESLRRRGEDAWRLPENAMITAPTCPYQIGPECENSFIFPLDIYELCGENFLERARNHENEEGEEEAPYEVVLAQ